MKERIEIRIGIKRFSVLFSNIWKRETIYKAKRIRKRVNSCPTPTFALNDGDVK